MAKQKYSRKELLEPSDPLVDFIEYVMHYVEENSGKVIGVIIAIVVIVAAFLGISWFNQSQRSEAGRTYAAARAQFDDAMSGMRVDFTQGRQVQMTPEEVNLALSEARKGLEKYAQDFKGHSDYESTLFLLAKVAFLQGNLDDALSKLENYKKAFPKGFYLGGAAHLKAAIEEQRGNPDAALSTLQRFVSANPEDKIVYTMRMDIGRLQKQQGKLQEAKSTYQGIMDDVGEESPYYNPAKTARDAIYRELGEEVPGGAQTMALG